MKPIKIECPSCQQPIEIESPSKGLPKPLAVATAFLCLAIGFCLGRTNRSASAPKETPSINQPAATIQAPAASAFPADPAPAPLVETPQPTNDPSATGAFGWYLGAKLPAAYSFDPAFKPQHVYSDLSKGRMKPFEQADIGCLQDRTIWQIQLTCLAPDQFSVIQAALDQKYGKEDVQFSANAMTYFWLRPDARIELTRYTHADGFAVAYESIPLQARSVQEYQSSNSAAASKIVSHL